MSSGIYAIRHNASGKCYVGSAVNVNTRWANHRKLLRLGKHHSPKLQAAWNKYGPDAMEFVVLEPILLPEELIAKEQHWINTLDAARHGYNILAKAGSMLGFKHTEATKEKCRAAKVGKPMPAHVMEILRKVNTGRPFSAEHLAKIAATSRRKHSPESVEKTAAAHRGAKRSEETRRRMSEASKGHKRWLGKRHTEETKQRISAAKKGSRSANAKLSDDDVREVRRLRADGVSRPAVAKQFGVSTKAISLVTTGRSYSHVSVTVSEPLPPELRGTRVRAKAIENGNVDADGVILEAA